jgi:hypothetical protein
MLTRCLHCYQPFPTNQTLSQFEVGRRIAFDPDNGRLWAVCPTCYRWTLAPIEQRWETLEELERLSRGKAHLLAKSDNIALLRAEDIEIVRIGGADRQEEAWWRYGNQFLGRRARAHTVIRFGQIFDAAAMLLTVGLPLWRFSDSGEWLRRARRRHFGRHVWVGSSSCPRCGHELVDLLFDERSDLILEANDGLFPILWYSCPICGNQSVAAGHRFTGTSAEIILRRLLAYENYSGGDEAGVREACAWIDSCGSAERALQAAADQRFAVGRSSGTRALAMEIALTTRMEQSLREMELKCLEARWRDEEVIAAIVDRELTPP